jgi:signal transduction histidine kinase
MNYAQQNSRPDSSKIEVTPNQVRKPIDVSHEGEVNGFQYQITPKSSIDLLTDILATVSGVVYRARICPNRTATLVYVSDGIRRLTGLEPEEAIAHPEGLLILVHPSDRDQFYMGLNQSIATSPLFQHKHRLNTMLEEVKWIQHYARFLPTAQGDVLMEGVCLEIPNSVPAPQLEGFCSLSAKLFIELTQRIHQTLHLSEILNITVTEVRRLLQADRVIFSQVLSNDNIVNIAESVGRQWSSMLNQNTYNAWSQEQIDLYRQGHIQIVENTEYAILPEPVIQRLHQHQAKAVLIVPILFQSQLWGLLAIHSCTGSRSWDDIEVEFLQQFSFQVGIAIQRSNLYQQLEQLNHDLERKFRARTAELELAFEFEATLKRITDKVRDSLDENQILQTAVQELALAIGVSGCNAALYDLDQGTSTIYYEYAATVSPSQGRVAYMKAFPKIYEQLFQGLAFQFCSITPSPVRGHVAMLTCPILDDQGVLGDLWLINHKFYAFSEQEIRLVQQVANQCAIALRQARLYKAAQNQVAELERLNGLKDDFLSTVSHELRTPIASIKMATQMLELTLNKAGLLKANNSPIARYLQILQSECNREINLVNDLLDLSRLETDTESLKLVSMPLQDWLSHLIEPFVERTEKQHQQLQVKIPSGLTSLKSDFAKLDRILIELLHNACKYTPPKERIQLTVETDVNRLIINVSNSGVEIPSEERSRIFDKFYRIPNTNDPWKHGGTGLGLALVKKLVEQLNGNIQVSSEQGVTTFTVRVPLNLDSAIPDS